MIIKNLEAREIFSGDTLPTIEVIITLENNQEIKSSTPTSTDQLNYKYDSESRLLSKGMKNSVKFINEKIAPMIIGNQLNALAMDSILMDLRDEVEVGDNTTLAVSYALFKAQSINENGNLFELLQSISGSKKSNIPKPLISAIKNSGDFKEFLIIPQEDSISEDIDAAATFFHHAKQLLKTKKIESTTTSNGSLFLNLNDQETINFIIEIFKTIPNYTFQTGITVDADKFYDQGTSLYKINDTAILSNDLIENYKKLISDYPFITYLGDCMATSDTEGWKKITTELDQITIAGDYVFKSDGMKIRKGILKQIGNCTIIRPELIGTVSRTIAAINACKKHAREFIIAADSGQTCETLCTDLSSGTEAKYLKGGGISHSEYISNYNRLLKISSIKKLQH